MRRYTCLVLCVAIGCSQGPKRRVLSDKVDVDSCAVDERFVYVKSIDTLSKVDRQTGVVEFLTNDTRYLRTFLPIAESVYWLDQDGIYVLKPGTSTRTTIAEYPRDDRVHSLTLFGNRLCWSRDDRDIESRSQRDEKLSGGSGETRSGLIECYDLASKKIEPWFAPTGRSPRVAAYGGRLYAAVLRSDFRPSQNVYSKTVVLDITNPATPLELFSHPGASGWFTATSEGPTSFAEYKLWVSSDRTIGLDSNDTISVIDGRIYLTRSKRAFRIDLKSGNAVPVAGANGPVMCGDSKATYVRGARGELVEIPTPNG